MFRGFDVANLQLDNLETDELRELGHDLEPVVSRQVRARSRDDLEDEVERAVDDGREIDPDGVDRVLEDYPDAYTADTADGEGDAGEKSGGTPNPSLEVMRPVKRRIDGDLYHVRRNQVLINPPDSLFEFIRDRVPHKELTEREALEKCATRRRGLCQRHSRLESDQADDGDSGDEDTPDDGDEGDDG